MINALFIRRAELIEANLTQFFQQTSSNITLTLSSKVILFAK